MWGMTVSMANSRGASPAHCAAPYPAHAALLSFSLAEAQTGVTTIAHL